VSPEIIEALDLSQKNLETVNDLWSLWETALTSKEVQQQLEEQLGQIEKNENLTAADAGRLVAGYTAINRLDKAAGFIEDAGSLPVVLYAKALMSISQGDLSSAREVLTNLNRKKNDSPLVATALAKCLRMAGELEKAEKALANAGRDAESLPEFHCEKGRQLAKAGEHDAAFDAYQTALEIDPDHQEGNFCLSTWYDRWGMEDQALVHLKCCVETQGAVYPNAVLNLAAIYEDKGEYLRASSLIESLRTVDHNHERAVLYTKDINGSTMMLYDEEREREVDRRRTVLQTPITDFELSVRSRSCLERMNILTLSDLISKTEQELLVYKNFGETSLNEIKYMLSQMGLHLGMGEKDDIPPEPTPPQESLNNLDKSVEVLQLSMRSRSALEQMGVTTLGDLADRTGLEILSCKNVGKTTLKEILDALGEFGLTLKEES